MQTLFVTGADGFVGSHLLQYFRQRGYEVVAGVRNRARKLALERRFGKALVCDVSDAINVARSIASVRPDGVIHLAGITNCAEAAGEPLIAYQSIVTAWANVLDAVRRAVPRAKVVLASSCEVYGDAGSSNGPLNEDTPLKPVSTFGSLKKAAESIANTFYENYHLDVAVARPFHCIGANQPDDTYFGAVAKRIANWNGESGSTLSWHDLHLTRDVLHIQDVVEAYERLLRNSAPNGVYNICSGRGRTCREIVEAMIQSSGKSITLAERSLDEEGGSRITSLVGDNGRIQSELNWSPTHTLEQAARELVRGYEVPAPAGHWA